jgi:hypothetical protein
MNLEEDIMHPDELRQLAAARPAATGQNTGQGE